MGNLVQRPERTQAAKLRQTIGGGQKGIPSWKQQQWAIGLADALEDTAEQADSRIRNELGMAEKCEELDEPGRYSAFFDPSGPGPDDDVYDFGEYDEDNPLLDPDGVMDSSASWEASEFDILDASNDPEPVPDIIFDEFGYVTIPLEDSLYEGFGKPGDGGAELSIKGRQYLANARVLRVVAEALIEKEGELILGGETDFAKITLLPLTQKELMAPLGIEDKPTRARITNRYIKTPYWGVLHLSVFFKGVEAEWREIMDHVRETIKREDVENPYSNEWLWSDISRRHSLSHNSNRQFRNELRKAGIPLQKPRKDIYKIVGKWKKKQNLDRVKRSEIPEIRLKLLKQFNLFSTKQTLPCREERFIPFVEQRIKGILQVMGVRVE